MLKRTSEQELAIIAPAYEEHVVEFWRSLLDILTVQTKLDQERHRLSVLQG